MLNGNTTNIYEFDAHYRNVFSCCYGQGFCHKFQQIFVLMFQALGERMSVMIKENEAIMTEVLAVSFHSNLNE